MSSLPDFPTYGSSEIPSCVTADDRDFYEKYVRADLGSDRAAISVLRAEPLRLKDDQSNEDQTPEAERDPVHWMTQEISRRMSLCLSKDRVPATLQRYFSLEDSGPASESNGLASKNNDPASEDNDSSNVGTFAFLITYPRAEKAVNAVRRLSRMLHGQRGADQSDGSENRESPNTTGAHAESKAFIDEATVRSDPTAVWTYSNGEGGWLAKDESGAADFIRKH